MVLGEIPTQQAVTVIIRYSRTCRVTTGVANETSIAANRHWLKINASKTI